MSSTTGFAQSVMNYTLNINTSNYGHIIVNDEFDFDFDDTALIENIQNNKLLEYWSLLEEPVSISWENTNIIEQRTSNDDTSIHDVTLHEIYDSFSDYTVNQIINDELDIDILTLTNDEQNIVQFSNFITLSPSTDWLNLHSGGGSIRDVIITSNVPLLSVSSPAWINLEFISGGFRLITQHNPVAAVRTGIVSVTGGGITQSFTVSQLGATPFLTITPASNWSNIPALGGVFRDVFISTNIPSVSVSHPSWMSITNINGVVRLTSQTNQIAELRTGTVSVFGSGIVQSFTISQLGATPFLMISPSDDWLGIPALGGFPRNIAITSNIPSLNISCSSWISCYFAPNGVTLVSQSNNIAMVRTGAFIISGAGVIRGFNVVQQGATPFLNISPSTDWLNIHEIGGETRNVIISSNIPNISVYKPIWLNIEIINNGFKLTSTINSNDDMRSESINVVGGGITKSFKVSQNGNGFIWCSNANWVGYWPNTISIGVPNIIGQVPPNFDLLNSTDIARLKWETALGVPLDEDIRANASIQVIGGSLEEMKWESGVMSDFAGLCIYPTQTSVAWIMIDNESKTVRKFSGQSKTFITYGNNSSTWTPSQVTAITVHEIAHALGWAGHAENPIYTMYYLLQSNSIGTISHNEARHLRQIYDIR
jgi:hypothetical protein